MKEQEAKLECFIQSPVSYNVSWLVGQNPITNQDGLKILKNLQLNKSTLVINKVNERFSNTYTCIVSNEYGCSNKIFYLDYAGLFNLLFKSVIFLNFLLKF